MGAQMLHMFMVFVDNIMVGRLGRDPLAGLALAGALYGFAHVIVTGLMSALVPLIARANGAERYLDAGHYARQGLVVAAITAVVVGAGMWWAEPVLLAIGQKPAPSALAGEYLRVMVLTVPAQLLFLVLRNFVEGAGNSVPTVAIAAAVALLNIPLDYMLVFGHFGAPALGVAGAAAATAGLTWLSVLLLLLYVVRQPEYRKYELFQLPRPHLPTIATILRIGVPLSGSMATEMTFFMTTTLLMGRLGEVQLAAHQVALNAAAFVFMLPLGLSFAVSIRVGHHLGRDDWAGARSAWLASILITSALVTATMSAFLFVPHHIVDLYDQEGEVRDLAVRLLVVGGFFQAFDGFQAVGIGVLRGLADTRYAFWATVVAYWVVGIAVVAWQYHARSPHGLWFGLLSGLLVAAFAHHVRAAVLLRRGPADRA